MSDILKFVSHQNGVFPFYYWAKFLDGTENIIFKLVKIELDINRQALPVLVILRPLIHKAS
jgi:hypothetical protein